MDPAFDRACADCGAHFQVDPEGDVQSAACPECGGTRFFENQPSPIESEDTIRDMPYVDDITGIDTGGNPLLEGNVTGPKRTSALNICPDCLVRVDEADHKCPYCGKVLGPNDEANLAPPSDSQKNNANFPLGEGTIEFDGHENGIRPGRGAFDYNHAHVVRDYVKHLTSSLDMEPYTPLWENEPLSKIALPNQKQTPEEEDEDDAPYVPPIRPLSPFEWALIEYEKKHPPKPKKKTATDEDGVDTNRIGDLTDSDINSMLGSAASVLMMGALSGQGEHGDVPADTDMTSIPRVLTADIWEGKRGEVPAVDILHDDPQKQDQKEFDDNDKSPSNFHNPNNEDSGASGEDGEREYTPGYGYSLDAEAMDHIKEMLPLILQYYNSPESGMNHPELRQLHETLESKMPGYLHHRHPHGEEMVERLLQHYHAAANNIGQNVGVLEAINAAGFPSGLTSLPGTLSPMAQAQTQAQCNACGGPIDPTSGRCPRCEASKINDPVSNPNAVAQNATVIPTGNGMTAMPGVLGSRIANSVGPQTPEQKAAVIQLLIAQNRIDEIPNVELHPEDYAKEMGEISNDNKPIVQPPPPAMTPPQPPQISPEMNPQGAMPVPDMSQPGGGGGPMQPLAKRKTADGNYRVPRCPKCGSATTDLLNVGAPDHKGRYWAKCHSCDNIFSISISKRKLAEIPHPLLDRGWIDQNGAPLEEGKIYDLYTPGIEIPDEVKVLFIKPHEIGLKLVGDLGDVPPSADPYPDFTISLDKFLEKNYSMIPQDQDDQEEDNQGGDMPMSGGGTPGQARIPESITTDQLSDSYPNPGTKSSSLDWLLDDDEIVLPKNASSYISSNSLRNIMEQRVAGKNFTLDEQRELINERGRARNLKKLKLEGTHYDPLSDDLLDEHFLF